MGNGIVRAIHFRFEAFFGSAALDVPMSQLASSEILYLTQQFERLLLRDATARNCESDLRITRADVDKPIFR